MTHRDTARLAFESVEEELQAISRWMYENPELAYEEHASAQRLSAFLAANGFDVTVPAYGLDTAFEATLGSRGPRLVICCEYDALPEVGHACGHNIIATAALGAGVAVATVAEELGVRVTVLGTPAEEGPGGKVDLINAGAFEDAAASMMIHPGPDDLLDPSMQANQSFELEYHGKESHAAFAPEVGVNALDAFVQAYMNVATLRQQLHDGDRVHCISNHGGDASNIIPAYTRSTWGVRAATVERLRELIPKVTACFDAAALATGCRMELARIHHPYLNMVSHPVLAELFSEHSEALGRPMPRETDVGMQGGSSDMGNVSQVVPAIHPMVGIETHGAVNHQKEFADATVTSSGHEAIRDGALAMAYTIIDLAERDLLAQL